MIVEVVQALSSILIGCLVGLLAYLVPAALALGRPTLAAPRAVVRVPEHLCRSFRCALPLQADHLVEVEVLEKTRNLLKVRWPRGFGHLDAWIEVAEASSALQTPGAERVRVVEELPAYPLWSSSEFEAWLTTVGADLDALDAASAPAKPPERRTS